MNISQTYIVLAVVLMIIAFLVFFAANNRKEMKLTSLASFAFAFVLAGMLFGENRMIGYGLMGIGMILAVIDMVNKSRAT